MKWKNQHKSTGRVYPYLETFSHLMYWAYFKKIYLNGLNTVPDDAPVLLASNHPTAFIECAMVTGYVNAPVYNMARGDIFRKPFYRKLMESINMFPVYRKREGYEDSDRNQEVFEYCIDKLNHNQIVAIYVEGEHHSDLRVRPAQKGIARIAFAAYERHRLEQLVIYPMGNNFANEGMPRDEIMVNIGKPLYVKDYWTEYEESPGKAITRLCQDIELALRPVCFHLEHPDDDTLAQQLLTLHRSEHTPRFLPVVEREHPRFQREKSVLEALHRLESAQKEDLRRKTAVYFEALEQRGWTDSALWNATQWSSWTRVFFLLACFLPFLTGYVTSLPILWFSHFVARKTVRKKIFFGSVVMGTGFISGLLWYALWLLPGLLLLSWKWILAVVLCLFSGWFSMIWREKWGDFLAARRILRQPSARAELLLQRQLLTDQHTIPVSIAQP